MNEFHKTFLRVVDFAGSDKREEMLKQTFNLGLEFYSNELCRDSLSPKESTEVAEKLCNLFCHLQLSPSNSVSLLSSLVNLTGIRGGKEDQLLRLVVNSSNFISKCSQICFSNRVAAAASPTKEEEMLALHSAQLFVNLSRRLPKQLAESLTENEPLSEFISKLIDHIYLHKNDDKIGSSSDGESLAYFLGFLLMNLSTVHSVGECISEHKMDSLLTLLGALDGEGNCSLRNVLLQVVYNLSLRDEFHTFLLGTSEERADRLLSALLGPLLDAEDKLSDEETASLPLALQYWEHPRQWDQKLWEVTLCTLYQFCATRLGREFLRGKSIYPLLREMDNARERRQKSSSGSGGAANEKMLGMVVLPGEEEENPPLDVLRALIGILVRTEADMGIAERSEESRDPSSSFSPSSVFSSTKNNNLASIRQMGADVDEVGE